MVYQSSQVEVEPFVRVGRYIACVVSKQETYSGTEILVAVGGTSCTFVVGLFHQVLGRIHNVVIGNVNLWTCKEVTFSQTEKEPRVNLYAAVAILAGRIASYIVLVGIVSHPIEVFLGILECKLSEDTEAVVLEEKLWFDHQIQSPVEHESYGSRDNRTAHGGIFRVHAERHQGASAYQQTEVWSITRASQYVIVKIAGCFFLFFELFLRLLLA